MFKSVADQSLLALTTAAALAAILMAGLAIVLPVVAPEAKAESQLQGAVHQPLAKGDRLPAFVIGTACSTRGWPHFEPSCQFDTRRPASAAGQSG